jgi:hypothetical protein
MRVCFVPRPLGGVDARGLRLDVAMQPEAGGTYGK